jgi:hypothetical protein
LGVVLGSIPGSGLLFGSQRAWKSWNAQTTPFPTFLLSFLGPPRPLLRLPSGGGEVLKAPRRAVTDLRNGRVISSFLPFNQSVDKTNAPGKWRHTAALRNKILQGETFVYYVVPAAAPEVCASVAFQLGTFEELQVSLQVTRSIEAMLACLDSTPTAPVAGPTGEHTLWNTGQRLSGINLSESQSEKADRWAPEEWRRAFLLPRPVIWIPSYPILPTRLMKSKGNWE